MAFSRAVSHDLGAPLRHIESFGEILFQTYGNRLDEQGRDLLGRVARAAKELTSLVGSLTKLSEATRGEMRRETVDLSKIAADLEGELRKAEPGRRVDFSIQQGLSVPGDSLLLRLALENLLRNAWKYTSRKEHAHIVFGRTDTDGSSVYFVRDDGVGFNMNYAGKLFQPFSRLHKRGDFEGSGIGLATVQRVIRRHGGRIWGESRVDEGATFFFTLPESGAGAGGSGDGR